MKVKNLISQLNLQELVLQKGILELNVNYLEVGDMLSVILGKDISAQILVTINRCKNVIAVAVAKDIPILLYPDNHSPDEEFLKLAEKKGISVLMSGKSIFEVVGEIYCLLKKENGETKSF